jgi:C1A family cysteine protease
LSNDYNYDLLIYESFPLLSDNGTDNFSNQALETKNISSNVDFSKIRIEVNNATLNSLTINILEQNALPMLALSAVASNRIMKLNNNLRGKGALWVAGETSISQMTFEEKKHLFGGNVPNLNGFEYYVGGIFEIEPDVIDNLPQTSDNYVSSFDWRKRHSADNPSSPYFNSGGDGWLTHVREQGGVCGSCWAFSALGSVEALTNLYFNQFINPDLSEQDLISCNSVWNCVGGTASEGHLNIKKYGVVDENTFPYQGADVSCSEKGTSPNEKIKITGLVMSTEYFPITFDILKQALMQSPVSLAISSWEHAMTLVGYKTIQAGDTVYQAGNSQLPIIVTNGDRMIGKTS